MPLLMSNRGGICPPSKCAPAEFVNSIFLPLLKKGTRGAEGADTLHIKTTLTVDDRDIANRIIIMNST